MVFPPLSSHRSPHETLLCHLATARNEPQMRGTSLREEGREEQPQPGRAAGDAVAAILQTWE